MQSQPRSLDEDIDLLVDRIAGLETPIPMGTEGERTLSILIAKARSISKQRQACRVLNTEQRRIRHNRIIQLQVRLEQMQGQMQDGDAQQAVEEELMRLLAHPFEIVEEQQP